MNNTVSSKADFTIYRKSSHGLLYTLSATVDRKVIWAQVALCKLTTGADLTVVAR